VNGDIFMVSWSRLLVITIFFCLLIAFSISSVYSLSEVDTVEIISEAEDALDVAYEAVSKAEQVGADVSGLWNRLSLAGEYLAEANVKYRVGSYENADYFAGLCIEMVSGVKGEAIELSSGATRQNEIDFFVSLFWSSVGVVIVGVTGFMLWIIFRRRYLERILKMKPEVVSGES
jgi:hypothetical protein